MPTGFYYVDKGIHNVDNQVFSPVVPTGFYYVDKGIYNVDNGRF